MKKIRKTVAVLLLLICIPIQVLAAGLWSGNNVYKEALHGEDWGVTASEITRVNDPGTAYRITDISNYSAYITNSELHVGKKIESAFYWFNKSRLGYVKLIKVNPGQTISFLFEKELYVCCAEFNDKFELVYDGNWVSTADRCKLTDTTSWIMLIFRKVNGDLSKGSGTDTEIQSGNISASARNYVIFKPFKYTFDPAGGNCMGGTGTFVINRLGVTEMALPVPTKTGYTFLGWRPEGDTVDYKTLTGEYVESLFKDTTLTAQWAENGAESVKLDRAYYIMEAGSGEKIKLNASVLPSDILNKKITWSSNNENIAKVDSSGLVTVGSTTGVATITATAASGVKATCKIYAMSFSITLPTYCTLNQAYEIKINVYNNGSSGMSGRKRVILDTDDSVELVRIGDSLTKYDVLSECCDTQNGSYQSLNSVGFLADTMSSKSVYYRLTPEKSITKAGDYESSVEFSVMVLSE